MRSELSFEEYANWCQSRFPASDPESSQHPDSYRATLYAGQVEAADIGPVTVRSGHNVLIVPSARGSR